MRDAWRRAALALLLITGCDRQLSSEVEELAKGQKEILAKLERLEKAVNQIKGPSAATPRAQVDPTKVYTLDVEGRPLRGSPHATVTIVEFADFQCPFCAQSKAVIDQVLETYPRDVRFVFKQFPLPASLHPFALGAARAVAAAERQGKFWEMHDLLFAHSRELQPEKLKEYAGTLGLDVDRFERDLASPEIQQSVDKDVSDGRAADVQGTPTFFVNGRRLLNRSLDGFRQLVDEALLKKD